MSVGSLIKKCWGGFFSSLFWYVKILCTVILCEIIKMNKILSIIVILRMMCIIIFFLCC